MSLLKYTFRRILALIPVIFGVLTLTFILSRMMPEDPVVLLLLSRGHIPSDEAIAALRHDLGLDLPLILQYFRYLGELFTGDWGTSVTFAPTKPVFELIGDRLPITIDLTIFSMIIASYFELK
jgi:peptide/nickel transport system permease protein